MGYAPVRNCCVCSAWVRRRGVSSSRSPYSFFSIADLWLLLLTLDDLRIKSAVVR
jgi:hypothetical protein